MKPSVSPLPALHGVTAGPFSSRVVHREDARAVPVELTFCVRPLYSSTYLEVRSFECCSIVTTQDSET